MLKNPQFDASVVEWLDEYAGRGYLLTDSLLRIVGWNRWLEAKSGLGAKDTIGRDLFSLYPDLLTRQLDRLFEGALNGQVSVLAHRFHKYLIKLPADPESGLSEMQQTAVVAPLIRDGEVIGTITVIDDVSERVAREDELLAAQLEAKRANEAKDRFIAVLSHDLRTPLTAILGWARVFNEHTTDERMVRKGAEVIERNATIQLGLIEQILDISRINAAKLELTLELVDVSEVINATVEAMEPLAEAKGVRIDRALDQQDRRTTALDPKRFQQIIWNLISNALKFTPKGGFIKVGLEYSTHGFQMTVADTGKGISAESMPHLFEPLWQAESSGGHGGLGLGLAIVRNLVDLHGGSIHVESPGIDQGAVFKVRIPWSDPLTSHLDPSLRSNSHAM
jgi:hypothetical protein